VTLVGPGGTGKTRLALATGAELLSSFAEGVFFDLSALTDPSLVVPQIAQTLSMRETPGRSLTDTLTDYLSAKQTLLILDSLEQVIDSATDIATLLTGAPDLKVLVPDHRTRGRATKSRTSHEDPTTDLGNRP
jgi:predicted ATPase